MSNKGELSMKAPKFALMALILVVSACGGSNSSGSKDPAKRAVKSVDDLANTVKHFDNEYYLGGNSMYVCKKSIFFCRFAKVADVHK